MDGKIVLLMIAVVAVGMFALPSTLALYSGQHEFLNGSSVDCAKCHGATSGVTWVGGAGAELANSSSDAHRDFSCDQCHSSTTSTIESDYHAASAVGASCIGCHAGVSPVNVAGAGENNIIAQLNKSAEVHNNMTTTEGGANATVNQDYACIACHTMATINGSVIDNTNTNVSNITLTVTGTGWTE